MICKSECHKTAALAGPGGGRIMVAVEGGKFPAGTPHEQCGPCAAAEYAEILAEIQGMKDAAVLGPGLSAKWEKLLAKTEQVLKK